MASDFAEFARDNPEEALRLVQKLREKVVVPHEGQRPIVDSKARFKVINCGRRWGKVLASGTNVLTPDGWRDHDDLRAGDYVIDADGRATEVTDVFPHTDWQFFEVEFNDGTVIEAGAEHLWEVYDRRSTKVLRTDEIAETLMRGAKDRRWAVPLPAPIEFAPSPALLIDPYVVGCALGDATIDAGMRLCSDDPEIVAEVLDRVPEGVRLSAIHYKDRTPTYDFTGWGSLWPDVGLRGTRSRTKFVPQAYMRASVVDRLEVLRGLMDTDGWCYKGRASFCSSSKQLALDVQELVRSLGGRANKLAFKDNEFGGAWTLTFYTRPEMCPFRLARKAKKWNPSGQLTKKIVAVRPGRIADGQCISVASERGLYVVEGYTLTHNTTLAAKLLIQATLASPPGSVTWWVAPTYKVVKRGYREVLRQLPREYLTHDPQPDTNFDAGRSVILRFKNGSQIEFYSAERPEGMLGEGVTFAVLDEAAIMPSRIWQQVVSPTLMDHQGGACLISTPRGRNWFYQAWKRGHKLREHLLLEDHVWQ